MNDETTLSTPQLFSTYYDEKIFTSKKKIQNIKKIYIVGKG